MGEKGKYIQVLEGNAVYIDTSIYVAKKFNVYDPIFVSLKQFCQKNRVQFLITSIIKREIKDKLYEHSQTVFNIFKKLEREGLKSKFYKELNHDFEPNDIMRLDIEEYFNKKINHYIESCNGVELPISGEFLDTVLELYFNRLAPFGEGKKKSEFPDAFSIKAVESFLNQELNGVNIYGIYVISQDSDLERYCSNNNRLYFLKSIEEFLDICNKHDKLYVEVIYYLQSLSEQIKEDVMEEIAEHKIKLAEENYDTKLGNYEIYDIIIEDFNIVTLNKVNSIVQIPVCLKIDFVVTDLFRTRSQWFQQEIEIDVNYSINIRTDGQFSIDYFLINNDMELELSLTQSKML